MQLFCGCVSTYEIYETSPYRVVEFSIFHVCATLVISTVLYWCISLYDAVVMCARHADWMHWKFRSSRRETKRTMRTYANNEFPTITAIFGMLRNDAACSFRFETNVAQTLAYAAVENLADSIMELRHNCAHVQFYKFRRLFWYRSKCLPKTTIVRAKLSSHYFRHFFFPVLLSKLIFYLSHGARDCSKKKSWGRIEWCS